MQASITIGGIEVALVTPAGALEKAVSERYASFLGASVAPVCFLELQASDGRPPLDAPTKLECVSDSAFRLHRHNVSGSIELKGRGSLMIEASPEALDLALRMLFGLLAPRHDTLLLRSMSVVSQSGAHVFIRPKGHSGPLGGRGGVHDEGLVALYTLNGVWMAASTPFSSALEPHSPPREAPIAQVWLLLARALRGSRVHLQTVLEKAYLPSADRLAHARSAELAGRLLSAVPTSEHELADDPRSWADICEFVS